MDSDVESHDPAKDSELEDRGAGHILIVLDHGTGSASISHDNVDLEHMVQLTLLLKNYIDGKVERARVEEIREQVRKELESNPVS